MPKAEEVKSDDAEADQPVEAKAAVEKEEAVKEELPESPRKEEE